MAGVQKVACGVSSALTTLLGETLQGRPLLSWCGHLQKESYHTSPLLSISNALLLCAFTDGIQNCMGITAVHDSFGFVSITVHVHQ